MSNPAYLYPTKGLQGGFFVRRELSADKKKYLYWLGHKTSEISHRVQVSLEFFLNFKKEAKRLRDLVQEIRRRN